LSSVRKQARTLLAATEAVRLREEKKLLESLRRKGLIGETASLDDILSLTVEDVLARRLQSMVFKKGMALSPLHSRQLIVHGHISVGGRVITVPSYEVGARDEGTVTLTGGVQPKEMPPPAEVPQAGQETAAEQPAQAQ
jgi:small subunit ribosomal protein S4